MAGPRPGDLRLPDADKDRRPVREADGLQGPGRNGPPSVSAAPSLMREMPVPAHRHHPSNKGTTPQRQSVPPTGAGCDRQPRQEKVQDNGLDFPAG